MCIRYKKAKKLEAEVKQESSISVAVTFALLHCGTLRGY